MVKPGSACMPRLSRAVKMQTSSMTQRMAGVDVLETFGLASVVPGIEFHHAGGIGDGLHAGQGEHHADKSFPILEEAAGQRLHVMHRLPKVRQAKNPQQQHHHRRRHRDQKRQAAGVPRTENVEQADDRDGRPPHTFPDAATPK